MAEEAEGQDTGTEAVAGGITGADPAAVALALNGASRDEADAFLQDQRAVLRNQNLLIDIQKHHLREQFKQLRLGIWEKRLGVLLRVATATMGSAIAAGLAFMVWNASQSSGLLIEPFSVPPDLAQRGMTGQVVAAKLLDRLSEMQAQTNTLRPAKSYTNNWGQAGIKLDIPETGVSLTELDDFLREKLGQESHITGEIVRTASGFSVTARTGAEGAETAIGSESELDSLVKQVSEAVYRATQPFRYGMYLAQHDRRAEAIPILKAVAETGSMVDRPWSSQLLGQFFGEADGVSTELRLMHQALAVEPDNVIAQMYIAITEADQSLPAQAMRDFQKTLSLLSSNQLQMLSANGAHYLGLLMQDDIDAQLGDFHDARLGYIEYIQSHAPATHSNSAILAGIEAEIHDLAAARTTLLDVVYYGRDFQAGHTALYSIKSRMLIDSEQQDWSGVLSDADALPPILQKSPGMRSWLPTYVTPVTAYAEARLGKLADAEAHISATPSDCYICLITRARIAELQGQHSRADWWFARAIDGQKSIPFAYSYWGEALMGRGDYDGAIAKFTIANQKGPKFADPLEMWGEILMLQKHPDQALAKFTESEKYAPNWGRLRLKWGEALGYASRKDEARAQYQKASTLDLTAADKAELARQMRN